MFLVLWLCFDFNGLYGQDSHEYCRYSEALEAFMGNGTDPGNFVWPKLFPMLGTVIGFTGIPIGFALQLISLLALLGAIYFAQRSLQLLYDASGSWFLLLAAATQVYFARSGLLVMSDALATFFVMGFVFNYLRFRQDQGFKYFAWIVLFASAGAFTRYAVLPLIAIPLLHGAWLITQKWNVGIRIASSLAVIVVGCLALTWNNKAIDLTNSIAGDWNPFYLFRREFLFQSHTESYWVPNGIYIWSNFAHVGYLSCGGFLLIWSRRWNFQLNFLWIGVLVYLVFLGGIGFQNQRFMVISHLIVSLLIYPSFNFLMAWLKHSNLA